MGKFVSKADSYCEIIFVFVYIRFNLDLKKKKEDLTQYQATSGMTKQQLVQFICARLLDVAAAAGGRIE